MTRRGEEKRREENTTQEKTREEKIRQDKIRPGKRKKDKVRQDKIRQEKTRQGRWDARGDIYGVCSMDRGGRVGTCSPPRGNTIKTTRSKPRKGRKYACRTATTFSDERDEKKKTTSAGVNLPHHPAALIGTKRAQRKKKSSPCAPGRALSAKPPGSRRTEPCPCWLSPPGGLRPGKASLSQPASRRRRAGPPAVDQSIHTHTRTDMHQSIHTHTHRHGPIKYTHAQTWTTQIHTHTNMGQSMHSRRRINQRTKKKKRTKRTKAQRNNRRGVANTGQDTTPAIKNINR